MKVSFIIQSVDVTKYILKKHSKENLFILSERFSQDPLENYTLASRGLEGGEVITLLCKEAFTMRVHCGFKSPWH